MERQKEKETENGRERRIGKEGMGMMGISC
jgi:hypothetical protein